MSMVLLPDSPWSEGHHRPHGDQRAPGRLAPGGGEDGDPASRWACVRCSPATVAQGSTEGDGLFEGENSLLSGPLL